MPKPRRARSSPARGRHSGSGGNRDHPVPIPTARWHPDYGAVTGVDWSRAPHDPRDVQRAVEMDDERSANQEHTVTDDETSMGAVGCCVPRLTGILSTAA